MKKTILQTIAIKCVLINILFLGSPVSAEANIVNAALSDFLALNLTTKLPFLVNDKSTRIKTAVLLKDSTRIQMVSDKIKNFDKKQKHYLIASFNLKDNTLTALVMQSQSDESYAWLVNYSKNGRYLDAMKVYYDNSEGNTWTRAVVKQKIIVVKAGNIYANDGKEVRLTYVIDPQGKFIKKTNQE